MSMMSEPAGVATSFTRIAFSTPRGDSLYSVTVQTSRYNDGRDT